jgi:hypothetical protein
MLIMFLHPSSIDVLRWCETGSVQELKHPGQNSSINVPEKIAWVRNAVLGVLKD